MPGQSVDSDTGVTVRAALAELAPKQRPILVPRYWEDLSVADTAELLGMRESTVKSRTARGFAALRAAVRENTYESRGGGRGAGVPAAVVAASLPAYRLAKLLPPGIGGIREVEDIVGEGPYDGFYAATRTAATCAPGDTAERRSLRTHRAAAGQSSRRNVSC